MNIIYNFLFNNDNDQSIFYYNLDKVVNRDFDINVMTDHVHIHSDPLAAYLISTKGIYLTETTNVEFFGANTPSKTL